MSDRYVTVERGGPVALVKFDRNKNLNAFDGQLILELTDVARSFHDDLETRAVVLTGSRDYFSAGADLVDLSARAGSKTSELEQRHVFPGAFDAVRPGNPCRRSPSQRWNVSLSAPGSRCHSLAIGAC